MPKSDEHVDARTNLAREDFGRQGFGAMRLGHDPDEADRDVAVINAALDAGVRMVDTADAYQNEELVGRAIAGRRDEILLASKFGIVWKGQIAGDYEVRADPGYVRQACEASLQRLGVDVIDLYYLHTPSGTPIEETMGAMADLARQGKIRAVGLSNVSAENLRRAHAVHPIAAVQQRWSLAYRDGEDELLPTVQELGITVVAHSPAGQGLLRDRGRSDSRVAGIRTALDEVAARHGATAGQVALAWVHERERIHGVPVVPIPGTTNVSHARANVAAADLRLSDDDLESIERA